MLKVAHVTTLYYGSRDGLEPKLTSLDSYKDIEITAIGSSKNQNKEYPPSHVRQLYCPMARSIKPLADLKSVAVLYKIFHRERFDIVHTHTAKAGMIGAIAARLARVPLVFHTSHGLPFYEGQNWLDYHKYRFLETSVCKFRDHYFSQNRRDIAECIKMMGSADKVSYEGNGVDVNAVRSCANEKLEQAERDFYPGGVRLVLASRLEPVKHVSDFLHACKSLLQDGIEISALVAGRGPLESELAEELKELGLDSRVRMLGWVPYAPSLIKVSDIVVLTSAKEGIPRAVMEGMALVKPVVATDVPGTQEVIIHGETGFLVPLGDTNAMTEKIKLLASDVTLRRKMGSNGLRMVQDKFDDTKITQSLHDFYIAQGRKTAGK